MIAGVKAVNTSRGRPGHRGRHRRGQECGGGRQRHPINSNRYIALMSYITLRCSLTGNGAILDSSPRSSSVCHAVPGLPCGVALRMTSVLDSMGPGS